ncbi:MAG: PUA domain-containing protein [Nitrososphaerota archaeon]
MKASYLSKKETSKLLEKLEELSWFKPFLDKKVKNVFRIEAEDATFYKIQKILLVEKSGLIFPTLIEQYSGDVLHSMPYIVVDMGAVSHIVNGADIMRPGVREVFGVFNEDDILVVKDEKNKKPIAIARCLVNHEGFKSMSRGKVAENIHHIDDKVWKMIRQYKELIER